MRSKKILLKIGINTLFQSVGKIITAGLGFISVMLLTRYLGPTGYGNFSIVFAYVSLFAILSDFGLQTTIIHHLAQNKERKVIVYDTFFLLKICLSAIASLIAITILPFFHYSSTITLGILLGSFAIFISNITGFATAIFQSEIRLGLITMIDVVTKIATVAITVLFIFLKLNFYYIILSVAIGNLAGLIFSIYYVRKITSFSLHFHIKEAKNLLKKSVTIGFVGLLSVTYFKLDTVMLSIMKGATDVGIYSLAYKIFENSLVFWAFYTASFFPLLAKFHGDKNHDKFRKLLINSTGIALFYAFGIILIGYIFAPLLIDIFGGHNFIASIAPFRILVFSSFFFFMTNIFYYYFFIKNKTYILLGCIAMSLLFNFFANLIVIPHLGYIGTSYTTIATEAFLMIIYIIIFLRDRKKAL